MHDDTLSAALSVAMKSGRAGAWLGLRLGLGLG